MSAPDDEGRPETLDEVAADMRPLVEAGTLGGLTVPEAFDLVVKGIEPSRLLSGEPVFTSCGCVPFRRRL